MSSIRLYILAALADEGEMHGHQLRQLAELEHVTLWTDISVGNLYGALKRLAAEGLIEELRTEREGSYPQRSVYGITAAGRRTLAGLRRAQFGEPDLRPDPFDLALARLDRARLDELKAELERRIARLRLAADETVADAERAAPYLSIAEKWAFDHRIHRIRSDIEWHDQLLAALPAIIADEKNRTARHD